MEIREIHLSAVASPRNGSADASQALRACLEEAGSYPRSVVVLEPGDYLVDSREPLPLYSGMTVRAEGAVFCFPRSLRTARSRVLFSGENVQDLQWYGGHFIGYVYDPRAADNDWEPADYTGCLQLIGTDGCSCSRVLFSGITAENVAGAVIHVRGSGEHRQRTWIFGIAALPTAANSCGITAICGRLPCFRRHIRRQRWKMRSAICPGTVCLPPYGWSRGGSMRMLCPPLCPRSGMR